MRRRPSGASAAPGDGPSLFDSSRAPESSRDDVDEIFPGASPRSAIAISTLTETAKDVVEGAFIPLWVRGEVTDFKAHRNGHWYFSLRDLASQLRCVVWSRDQRDIRPRPMTECR